MGIGALMPFLSVFGGISDWFKASENDRKRNAEKQDALQRMDDQVQRTMYGDEANGYRGLRNLRDDYASQRNQWAQDIGSQANSIVQGLQSSYGNLKNQQEQLAQILNSAYGDRTNQAMGMVANYGDQAKRDISDRYKTLDASQRMDITNRGLGNTIMGASMQSGNQQRQDAEQRRLAEDVARVKLDTHGQYTGDQLRNQQDMGAMGLQLGQMAANSLYNANQWATGEKSDANMQTMMGNRADEMGMLDYFTGQTDKRNALAMDWGPDQISPSLGSYMTQAYMPFYTQAQENKRARMAAQSQQNSALMGALNPFKIGFNF
ncbi:MAG: hypothetical protein FWC56_05105 [Phycisphaerae bacterium]|nr:hypothetical protein [Phycisphaerae bacterium]